MNEHSQQLMRAITGPIILITVGVLFTVDRFTAFGFGQTWPILIIVIGLLKLFGGRRRRDYVVPPSPGSSHSGASNTSGSQTGGGQS